MFLLLAAGLAATAWTQQPGNAPLTPDVAEFVALLVGNWDLEVTTRLPDEPPTHRKMTMKCSKAAAGRGVLCVKEGNSDFGKLVDHCLGGVKASDGTVHWMCIGSTGDVHDYTGFWKEHRKIEFEPLRDLMDSQPVVQRISYSFPDDQTLLATANVTARGGAVIDVETKGRRRKNR